MTPLPITLCGPILHTLVLGLFRELPALRGSEEKILLPLPNGTKLIQQHLSVWANDLSVVTQERHNICWSFHFCFEKALLWIALHCNWAVLHRPHYQNTKKKNKIHNLKYIYIYIYIFLSNMIQVVPVSVFPSCVSMFSLGYERYVWV